jgi:hypothetical protein
MVARAKQLWLDDPRVNGAEEHLKKACGQKIPQIAARKLYVHFAFGFDSVQRSDVPSIKDLQRCTENGELNFQKLVREAYGCAYITPSSGFNYEKLLDISDEVREHFFSILNTKSPREYDVETFPC